MPQQATPPTVDPLAAAHWQQLPASASPWLHEEVARRMQARLDWIKSKPASWAHWAPWRGGWQSHAVLADRYPQASCILLEPSASRGTGTPGLAFTLVEAQDLAARQAPTGVAH